MFAVNVFPSATVKVAEVAGAVIVSLLILVAEATPSVGEVKVGLVSVLFVSVCVAPSNTNVPFASGAVKTLVFPAVIPEH